MNPVLAYSVFDPSFCHFAVAVGGALALLIVLIGGALALLARSQTLLPCADRGEVECWAEEETALLQEEGVWQGMLFAEQTLAPLRAAAIEAKRARALKVVALLERIVLLSVCSTPKKVLTTKVRAPASIRVRLS